MSEYVARPHLNVQDSGVRFEISTAVVQEIYSQDYTFGFSESGLGQVVYLRSYSRRKADGEQEIWPDTVIRVIEGLFTLRKYWATTHHLPWREEDMQNLASDMAMSMMKMQWLPAGRGLWIMGTEYLYARGGMGLYNCAYTNMEDDLPPKIRTHWSSGTMITINNPNHCVYGEETIQSRA